MSNDKEKQKTTVVARLSRVEMQVDEHTFIVKHASRSAHKTDKNLLPN